MRLSEAEGLLTLRRIELQHCAVEFTSWGCITLFRDPKTIEVGAWPHPEMPDYQEVTRRLGYGDDCLRYCQEHEFMHSFLAEWLYGEPSKVLYALARSTLPRKGDSVLEEVTTQVAQRWVRVGERPVVGWCDWDGLKRRALELLDG